MLSVLICLKIHCYTHQLWKWQEEEYRVLNSISIDYFPSIYDLVDIPLGRFISFAGDYCWYSVSARGFIVEWVHPMFQRSNIQKVRKMTQTGSKIWVIHLMMNTGSQLAHKSKPWIKWKLGILVEIEDDTNFIEYTWEFDIKWFLNFYEDI